MLDTIKNEYIKWIKDNTSLDYVLNDAIEISSPFIDSLSENIKLYIEPNNHKFKVTDDGYTIWNLEVMGSSLRLGSQRYRMLQSIIDRYNISFDNETKELFINADHNNLGNAIHSLLQTTLTISDALKLDKKTIKNLFIEEVNNYFKENSEIFDPFPDIEIQGKSKLMHRFDYLMNVKNKQKKLVRVVNNLDQVQLERILLSWQDTSQQRLKKYNENLGMVALINDKQKPIPNKFDEAFKEYGIEPIGFSNKEAVKESLSLVG